MLHRVFSLEEFLYKPGGIIKILKNPKVHFTLQIQCHRSVDQLLGTFCPSFVAPTTQISSSPSHLFAPMMKLDLNNPHYSFYLSVFFDWRISSLLLPQNKICLLGKGILSFKWQLSYFVMEVQFYLMDLIAQFAAPTSHCVGSCVWAELQDQCQNKTETCRGGKWGERSARKSICVIKTRLGSLQCQPQQVTPQVGSRTAQHL